MIDIFFLKLQRLIESKQSCGCELFVKDRSCHELFGACMRMKICL